MKKYVSAVIKKEKMDIDDEGISAVVRMGRGSVRDTLTALERFSETGENFANYGGRLLESFTAQNLEGSLSVIAEASVENEIKGRELAEQLFEDLRDLLLAFSGADASLYPGLPLENPKEVGKGMLGVRGISIAIEEIGDSLTRMTLGSDSRIHLEVAIVRTLQKLKQLSARLAK